MWRNTYCLLALCAAGVHTADIAYMERCIKDYFADTRHHEVNLPYKMAAKEFIFKEFQKFGFDTVYHNFSDGSSQTNMFTNVIGILKGDNFGKADDLIIGIGAHYDTVATTKGVDDNGSGVAAMLEVARQLTEMNKNGTKRKNTILFVSFDLEEEGLAGSKAFLESWIQSWLAEYYGAQAASLETQGMIILDTMMEYNTSANSQSLPMEEYVSVLFPDAYASILADNYQGDFLVMVYRDYTNDTRLATTFNSSWVDMDRARFQLEAFPLSAILYTSLLMWDVMQSDHTNFWNRKIPALFLTDSANLRGDMQRCYHKPCDDLETMLTDDNINFLGKTADAITKTIHELTKYTEEISKQNTNGAMKNAGLIVAVVPTVIVLTHLLTSF